MVLVIADDLTGAMDTAAQFSMQGLKTEVVLCLDTKEKVDAEVIVINTETRNMSPVEARKQIHKALAPYLPLGPGTTVFKKIDSTLRGNVGLEIDTVLRLTDLDCAIVAPAFPANNRTVIEGRILVGQLPLSTSYAGRDVYVPVLSSYLPDILGHQLRRPMLSLTLRDLRKGNMSMLKTVKQAQGQGVQVFICDTEQQQDLELIASGTGLETDKVLWVGSAGLAKALSSQLMTDCSSPLRKKPYRKFQGKMLVLYGSPNPACREQVEFLRRGKLASSIRTVPGDVEKLEWDSQDTVVQYVGELQKSDVKALVVSSSNLDLDPTSISSIGSKIREFLADLAKAAIGTTEIAALVVSGGDVATAVLSRLEIEHVELLAECLPGIPLALARGKYGDIPIVTKAGGFGQPDTLARLLACISNSENDF